MSTTNNNNIKIFYNNISKKYEKILNNINNKCSLIVKIPSLNNCCVVINNKRYNCESFIGCIKVIINSFKNYTEKMLFLQNMCKNIPILIISSGPSSDIELEKIKKIENDYIIISVKYIRDSLLKNNINIDFTITSHWWNGKYHSKINQNEHNTISIHTTEFGINYIKDILFVINRDSKQGPISHYHTFQLLKKKESINIIKILPNKIQRNFIWTNVAHIMLEVADPATTQHRQEDL